MASDSQISVTESPTPEELQAPLNATTANQKPKKGLYWSPEMVETLLIGLTEQVRLGRRPVGSFKPDAYKAILPELQDKVRQKSLRGGYLQITIPQVKNKVSSLKDSWRTWGELLEQSGVGRDPETGAIDASDEWWEAYLQKVSATVLNT